MERVGSGKSGAAGPRLGGRGARNATNADGIVSSGAVCAADQLLRPARGWSVAQLQSGSRLAPDSPGLYGWWFRTLPPRVPEEGTLRSDFGHLLYIGIAPNGPHSSRTLRYRLRNHIQGPIGSSTLRRTLASLLAGALELKLSRTATNRPSMSADDEKRLTDWMAEQARVAWVVCDRPWELERQILVAGPRLPLNIQGSSDQFSKTLSSLRAQVLAG